MKHTVTISYPASATKVAEMLASPEYIQGRFARVGMKDTPITATAEGEGFSTAATFSVDPSRLPSAAQRFIKGSINASLTETWSAPTADGSRTGSIAANITGVPLKVSASERLVPVSEESTNLELTVDFSVTIPLVGKKIEERALGFASRIVEDEESRGAAWLASH